jgi:hypothetical protein
MLMWLRVLQLEKRVSEVVRFYDGKKHGSGGRKAGGTSRYAMNGARDSHCKGMPDLVRQLGGIIRQVIIRSCAALCPLIRLRRFMFHGLVVSS